MTPSKYTYQALLRTLEDECKAAVTTRVRETLRLAFEGHRGQLRDTRTPSSRIPFIVHPVGTARAAMNYFGMVESYLPDDLETVICIALTHDLLEDTHTDHLMIEEVAGPDVRLAVEALTKPPAGVVGKDKDARNREFLEQIINAGPTAVFVKLCDSMHNMSRANMTPLQLYRKVVDKAQSLYLPLLARCPLGNEFEQVYRSALAKAQQDVLTEERFARDKPVPQCLDDAVSECVAASAGKVLELHDITEILDRVCGTLNMSIWRVGGKNADTLSLSSASDASAVYKDTFQTVVSDSPVILEGQAASKFPISAKPKQDTTVYVVPMQIGSGRSFVAALVFGASGAPNWMTLDAAVLIVQFLAHRLIVSEADRRARVMTEAARLGIQVDAELATESGFSPPDLMRLDHWRTRCEQATRTVESVLDLYFLSDVSRDQLRQFIRVESRVKTVNSILRKLIYRIKESTSRFEEMEDIAGVRVVCPTVASIGNIQAFLQGERAAAAGCRLHPTISHPVRDWVTEPTLDGYRAVHLILEVSTYLNDGGAQPVPCEVQLRTIFQDIWARIAHDTLYATNDKNPKLEKLLDHMGKALQDCEAIAERIAKGNE